MGKFSGCTLAACYLTYFSWQKSATIGLLMSCKGYVPTYFHHPIFGLMLTLGRLTEIIVLKVGLSAGILTQRVFLMFVLEALVLTFITTPLAAT
jgi:hypothetical protein